MQAEVRFTFKNETATRPTVNLVVVRVCCARMSENFGDGRIIEEYVRIRDNGSFFEDPAVVLVHGQSSYGGFYTDEIPIEFCPFCGEKVEIAVVGQDEAIAEAKRRVRAENARQTKAKQEKDRAEYDRLKAKFEGGQA